MKGLILVLGCFFSNSLFCQGKINLSTYLHDSLEMNGFSGFVLAVKNQEPLINNGYGKANFELNVPNTNETKFRIGSLTKQFTSAAIMLLVQENKVNINDKLSRYLRNCPSEWAEVTLFHLLTHTSGIPDLFGKLAAVPVENTIDEIDRVITSPVSKVLDTFPGSKYRYNNFGYILLGYVIEKVTGDHYANFLNKKIFIPAGMINTEYDDPRTVIRNRAAGYRLKDGILYNCDHSDPAGFSAGGLLATANDFLKWDAFLYSGKLLSDKSLQLLFTPYKNDYAFGWKVIEKGKRIMQTHNGGTKGFVCCIIRVPEDHLLIVVFSNNEDELPWKYANRIYEIIAP